MNLNPEVYIHGGTQKSYYNENEVTNYNCPYCNTYNVEPIYKERGNLIIGRCKKCGLIYTSTGTKEPEKIYWGNSDLYFEEGRLIFLGKANHHRDKNYLHDLKILQRYKPNGKFLDIGTNMGFFLRHAKNMGWDVLGIEPSPGLSKLGQKYFNLNIINDFFENVNLPDNTFDIITMTDVFEHIRNPKEILQKAKSLLKQDGIIFIKVPNVNFNLLKLSVLKKLKKESAYDIFDSYEHVVHYNLHTLEKMLSSSGFKIIKKLIDPPVQIPVWHFYVGHYYLYDTPFCLDIKHYTFILYSSIRIYV